MSVQPNSVDVLCMDKTGTLTANELMLNAVEPLQADAKIDEMLGDFVRSVSSSNTTNDAIANGTQGMQRQPVDEVAFSSARKWSGLAFDSAERRGVYVLGAVEMLQAHLSQDNMDALLTQVVKLSERGLRVLLFAANFEVTMLHDGEQIVLPNLTPLALVSLRDKLRPQVAETLQAFQDLGVKLKIISGDNPQTVAALAKQAGLMGVTLVSGPELAQMSDVEVAQVAEEGVVFGRISPEQKRQLVDVLIQQGHYVAMIGDGVNDVLSLKKAKLGIAMQSGSNATRNVADMVLLDDSYAALAPALSEGKRIVNGITSATYLLIGRSLTYALIIIGVMMVGVSFPFEPAQVGLTTFSVGFPAFALTLWARPDSPREPLLTSLVRLIVPFALWTMLIGVLVYAFTYFQITDSLEELRIPPRALRGLENFTGVEYDLNNPADFLVVAATIVAQTSLSVFLTLTAIFFVLFLEPPHQFFTGWREVSPDRRPLWLVIGLTTVFLLGLNIKFVTDYFGMLRLPSRGYLALGVALLVWLVGLRFILRKRYFDALVPQTS